VTGHFEKPPIWAAFCFVAQLWCHRDRARLPRASEPLPQAGSLSLACPRESNHRDGGNAKRKSTPDDAPSGPAALQVRVRVTGTPQSQEQEQKSTAKAKAKAKRRSALSPLRLGALRCSRTVD